MHSSDTPTIDDRERNNTILMDRGILVKNLYTLSGNEILARMAEHEAPRRVVQSLPGEDFLWLVKKIGEDDATPILKLASYEQWQYLLDLEIWNKDILDTETIFVWLNRLKKADMVKLVKWFFTEGQNFAKMILYNNIEVIQQEPTDEVFELPDDFFTLDGVFHIRVTDSKYGTTAEELIRLMYTIDSNRARILLEEVAALIPAEAEEEMYRLRNVRLAEHGFSPFDEAFQIYSPLDPASLDEGNEASLVYELPDDETGEMVPVLPLDQTGTGNLLTDAIAGIRDIQFLDRARREFAGLCNQILSADGLADLGVDTLMEKCRKAAGYINIALESTCEDDTEKVSHCIAGNPLESIFRVGFGLVLRLKWKAESWFEKSWCKRKGLEADFWGRKWSMTLSGLLKRHPCHYTGLEEKEYRHFEKLSEVEESGRILSNVMALDDLFRYLDTQYPMDDVLLHEENLTFHALIVTFWARCVLEIDPGFSGITLREARIFFTHLRAEEEEPPYRMHGFDQQFVNDLSQYASTSNMEGSLALSDALSSIWQEFCDEYASVPRESLDEKYSKFILITQSSTNTV